MQKQSSIIIGLILILAGAFFLFLQLFPGVASQIDLSSQWPFILVGIGGLFLLGAFFGTPPLAIPGSVVAGIGLLLAYQNATNNWSSWSYAWTLIPGFVGLGICLMGLLDQESRPQIRDGLRLLFISLILFLVFGGIFGAFGQFWPLLLIIGGILLLLRSRRQSLSGQESADSGDTMKTDTLKKDS